MTCSKLLPTMIAVVVLALGLSAASAGAGIGGDEKNDQRIEKMVQEGREEYLKELGEKPYEGTVYSPTEFTPDTARSPQGGPPAKPGKPDDSPGGTAGGGGKTKSTFSGSGRANQ